jgi:hypothetical protein
MLASGLRSPLSLQPCISSRLGTITLFICLLIGFPWKSFFETGLHSQSRCAPVLVNKPAVFPFPLTVMLIYSKQKSDAREADNQVLHIRETLPCFSEALFTFTYFHVWIFLCVCYSEKILIKPILSLWFPVHYTPISSEGKLNSNVLALTMFPFFLFFLFSFLNFIWHCWGYNQIMESA